MASFTGVLRRLPSPELRRRLRRSLPWVLLAVLVGCGSSSTIRVLDARPVDRPLDRIYAVVFQGQLDGNHAEQLRRALTETFESRSAAFRVSVITGLELDDTSLKADIARFAPDGILLLKPIAGLLGSAGSYNVTYEAKLLAPNSGRPLWQARLRNEGAPVGIGSRMRLSARDLARHLTWDHLLKEKPDDELLTEGESE
jgi:hypothetical protein